MKRALEALVDEQREVLILTYFRGLSMSETSDALGIPLGTVKSRARTAMQQLREQMADSKGATGD